MKRKLLILILIILLILVYLKVYKPYKEEQDIKAELINKWSVDISRDDKLKIMKRSKSQWHGEHSKYILSELNNPDSVLNYIQSNNLLPNKMSSDTMQRIIEIEEDLEIKEEDKIDFDADYYYAERIKYLVKYSSEAKKDILYIVLIKGPDTSKMYIIEDLNVLDLERSF